MQESLSRRLPEHLIGEVSQNTLINSMQICNPIANIHTFQLHPALNVNYIVCLPLVLRSLSITADKSLYEPMSGYYTLF